MSAVSGKTEQWRFADVVVDTATFRLTVNGETRELQPKYFRLLTYLIENRERAVSKEEILQAVWDGVAVTDNALTRAVAQIRKAIDDDSRQPRYIETVPTVGYRFIAALQTTAAPLVPTLQEPRWLPATAALLAALGIIVAVASARRVDTSTIATQVEQLTVSGQYAQAYELAQAVLRREPNNATVLPLMSEITDVLTVHSTPPGAEVVLRRLDQPGEERLGVTPIDKRTVTRGEFILCIRKPGYVTQERTVSTRLNRASPVVKTPWHQIIQGTLRKSGEIPEGMTAIQAIKHRLGAYSRPTDATIALSPYFLDRYEVSNRDFKQFVDASGYRNPQLWRDPTIAATFHDKTGISAPRDWVGGEIPHGKADHPVTGITWHEADAYCRFRRKNLPTLFQWEEAARTNLQSPFGVVYPWGLLEPGEIYRRANFEGSGTMPVTDLAFGMSPYGAHHLAGNVSEWLANPFDDGYTTAGGGWSDPVYTFGLYQSRPAAYSDASLGFRCAQADGPSQGDQGAMAFSSKPLNLNYPPSPPAAFSESQERYRYDPAAPLNARITATQHNPSWRREEIAYDGFAGKRAKAYLYLPRNTPGPYQVIHYQGGRGWWLGVPVSHIVEDRAGRMAPFLREGRAVFLVVLEGFSGREAAPRDLSMTSSDYREMLREWSVDMRRGVDYLRTRPDIDAKHIAYWVTSTTEAGVVFAAVDGRYAAIILNGADVYPSVLGLHPDINPLHFAPHIRGPKLLLTGRYDELTGSRVTSIDPIYRLLPEPKKNVTYIGGHVPPNEIAVPLVNNFLNNVMGKVARHQP